MADTSTVGSSTGLPSYEDYVKQTKEARRPVQDLGKNEFLQLLVTQMQYQDPLEPTSNTDFIAQMAQFSTLEMMDQMSNSMLATQYYGLAGKVVYAEVTLSDGTRVPVQGVVEVVFYKDGQYWAQVGGYVIKASAITEVMDKDLLDTSNPLLESAHLIGKEVKGYLTDKDEEGNYIVATGIVTRITIESGTMVAYVYNEETGKTEIIALYNIFDVRDPAIDSPDKDIEEDEGDGDVEGIDPDGNGSVNPNPPTGGDENEINDIDGDSSGQTQQP